MTPLPRRVLHVMNGAAGGAAMSTVGLILELRRRGVDSAAVCLPGGTPDERQCLLDACEGRATFAPLYLWNTKLRSARWKRPLIEARQLVLTRALLGSVRRVVEAARAFEVDLIHTNTFLTLEGALAAHHLGLGHVWHLRELVGPRQPFRFPLEGRALGRVIAEHASVVVANSPASAACVSEWLPPGRLEVVENGIDLSSFVPRPHRDGDRRVVGMVGNLGSRVKKHALFVELAARVPRALDATFRIYGHAPAGDPYVRDLLARAEALGVRDRLELAGFVAEPAAIMRELSVLVHPADQESFGRIVVEAWAGGVPVVGPAAGGVGALVTSEVDGLLAAPDDASGLARQVERLLRSAALRAELSARGRATAVARCSIEAHADRMLAAYARALDTPLEPYLVRLGSVLGARWATP